MRSHCALLVTKGSGIRSRSRLRDADRSGDARAQRSSTTARGSTSARAAAGCPLTRTIDLEEAALSHTRGLQTSAVRKAGTNLTVTGRATNAVYATSRMACVPACSHHHVMIATFTYLARRHRAGVGLTLLVEALTLLGIDEGDRQP